MRVRGGARGRGGRGSGSGRGRSSPSTSNNSHGGKAHRGKGGPPPERFDRSLKGRAGAGRASGSFSRGRGRGGQKRDDTSKPRLPPRSARTDDIDINMASKISHEFAAEINNFKTKLQTFNFGDLDNLFQYVPPQFIQQHLPRNIAPFRTYLTRFSKGSANDVIAFTKWVEWAQYEANKGGRFGVNSNSTSGKDGVATMPEDDMEAVAEREGEALGPGGGPRHQPGQTRAQLRTVADERAHMRALVQMCLRHNSTKRKEGQHALINLFKEHLEGHQKVRTIVQLRETAHHSVAYALSRLLMGMAGDNASTVFLNTHVLYLILRETCLHPRVLLTLIGDELALATRMKAMELRLKHSTSSGKITEELVEEADVDPDEINDPSAGERRQQVAAGLFAAIAVIASDKPLTADDLTALLQLLSFCYIEHKSTRVLSGNAMMYLLRQYGVKVLEQPEAWKWVSFALFRFPKVEYFRPEAIQLLIMLMSAPEKLSVIEEPQLHELVREDPLDPSVLEKLVNGLFRKEQVTAVHPMIHPVWDDLLNIITERCHAGESLKAHITNFVHVVIAPYRRGVMEVPRRALFQKLVFRIGQLALQNDDENERMETVRVASTIVGFSRVAKPSDPATLRNLSPTEMNRKVDSLVRQYSMIHDKVPSANTQRTWALRELRSVLTTPVAWGIDTPYVDSALRALLRFGFFPTYGTEFQESHDELNKNRAIYLFADAFSFTFVGREGRPGRPHATLKSIEIIQSYLTAEEAEKTRFYSAMKHKDFASARKKLVEALSRDAPRSVLFFDDKDMVIMLTLLFLMVSVDDPATASDIVKSGIPDLVRFYQTGTIETIEVLVDVLMMLVLRTKAPLHILPLMTCIRRIAISYLYRFARYIKNKATLDLVLTPLVEAYNTNDRELIRQMKAEQEEAEGMDDNSESDSDASAMENEARGEEDGANEENEEGAEEEEAEEDSEAATEEDEATEADEEEDKSSDDDSSGDEESDDSDLEEGEEGADEIADVDNEEEEWEKAEEDEAPQDYIASLKRIVGDVDLGFVYPPEDGSRDKTDVVRAITLATRVSLGLQSPIVIHTFQVLLAVLRNNVKVADPVIFTATKSAIDMLLMSKNRFFGSFLSVDDLFQILGDIQSYCRKLERALLTVRRTAGDNSHAKLGGLIFKRLGQVKACALSVLHYIGFLAQKNNAGEDVRITIAEHYISIFFDKGFKEKNAMFVIKKDLYHFRHAFAWVFVPAAVEKFHRLREAEGLLRVRAFTGCCKLIEAFLPRLSGLSPVLKKRGAVTISEFLSLVTPHSVFTMKHTAVYDLVHLYKMVIEYNSKLQLDLTDISNAITTIIDDEAIQVSSGTVRTLSRVEQLLGLTPRAANIKAAVPLAVLYKQFETTWRKEKANFYRKAKAAKKKTIKALLAYRNKETTDEERARKRRRREELKSRDQVEREILREEKRRNMTPEEKMERRKKMLIAKQERIAKNRKRKLRLHEIRKANFEKWREAKLAEE